MKFHIFRKQYTGTGSAKWVRHGAGLMLDLGFPSYDEARRAIERHRRVEHPDPDAWDLNSGKVVILPEGTAPRTANVPER